MPPPLSFRTQSSTTTTSVYTGLSTNTYSVCFRQELTREIQREAGSVMVSHAQPSYSLSMRNKLACVTPSRCLHTHMIIYQYLLTITHQSLCSHTRCWLFYALVSCPLRTTEQYYVPVGRLRENAREFARHKFIPLKAQLDRVWQL
jgi:hypothetical protein